MRNISATLPNKPAIESDALQTLQEAVLWLDAAYSTPGEQVAKNLGTGGPALNAQYGSTAGVDTNDPLLLDWDGENYVSFPGSSGNTLEILNSSEFNISGNLEIVVRVSLNDWVIGTEQSLITKWNNTGAGVSWRLGKNSTTSGLMGFVHNGTTNQTGFANVTGWIPVDGETYWIKWQYNATTGIHDFYVNPDQDTEPTSWLYSGSAATSASHFPAVTATSIKIGATDGNTYVWPGKVYNAKVRNGFGGTTVLNVDCPNNIVDSGATSFVCTSGQTVTVNRSTSGRKTCLVTRPTWLMGTDDYLRVEDNALIDFGLTGDATVLIVIRTWHIMNYTSIMGKRASSVNTNPGWAFVQPNNFRFYVESRGGGVTDDWFIGPDFYSAGELNTQGFIRRQSGTNNTLLDTVKSTSVDSVIDLSNSEPFFIGRDRTLGGAFDCEVAAVAIWNRALTDAEIRAICVHYSSVPPSPAEQLLAEATLWLDAKNSVPGEQKAVNKGTGGSVLDATYGSTTGVDTNDPVVLISPGFFQPAGATSTNNIRTVSTDDLNITGDISIIVEITPYDFNQDRVLLSKRSGAVDSAFIPYSLGMWFGDLKFSWRNAAGVETVIYGNNNISSVIKNYEKIFLGVTFDADNGAGQNVTKFWWSGDGILWNLAQTITTAGVADIRVNSSDVGIAGVDSGTAGVMGIYHSAKIFNTPYFSDSPVLHWEASDMGQTGGVSNGRTWTIYRPSTGQKAVLVTRPIWLFGTDDYLEIADNALLDFNATDDFTLMAITRQWATPPSFSSIIGKGDRAVGIYYSLYNNPGTVVVAFEADDNVNPRYGDTSPPTRSAGALLASFGGVRDSGVNVFSELGEGIITQTRSPLGSLENSAALRIGHQVGGAYTDMECVAVAVFRRALTAGEIALINSHYGTV